MSLAISRLFVSECTLQRPLLLVLLLLLATIVSAQPATSQTSTVRSRVRLGEWSDKPTRRLGDLDQFTPANAQLDRFGGWASGEKQRATGSFYAKKIGERWWLIDPDGNPFLHVAMNGVTPGKPVKSDDGSPKFRFSERAKAWWAKRFGNLNGWRDQTISLLRENGFNGTGSWSADDVVRESDRPLAYTPNLGWMSKYGSKRGGTFATPGHTGYPNDCIFAFDPEFAAFCDEQAKSLAKLKDDPYLLGYFSDNEMPFPKDSLKRFLALPAKDTGRVEAEKWIEQHKIDPAKIDEAGNDAWLAHVADAYYGTVARAIKKYDPNHVYLGSRFYGSEKRCEPLFRAVGKHLDIISVNLYGQWTPASEVKRWAEWSGKPVLITEFYAKGNDSGMPNKEGAGFTVETQKDRGAFYQNFTLALLETKDCIGWHWFKYIDNDLTDTSGDLSNQDANKGIVDAEFKPWDELLAAMKQLNTQIYPLTMYLDRK
jgi:hypothetical protein